MSYDTKCAELAEAFLKDSVPADQVARHTPVLAQHIQDAIESYIQYELTVIIGLVAGPDGVR